MVIKNPLVTGTIKKLKPNIYGVSIKDHYDRAMVFCCFQEFYESPFKEIRGQDFTLETFMRVYTKKNKKEYFTYPYDWGGYNIPSESIYRRFEYLQYPYTPYDSIMLEIINYCEDESYGEPFYLIGADNFKSQTMEHEIAHGLYYTNLVYKNNVDLLTSNMPKKEYNFVKRELIKLGYVNDKVIIDDELQAFFSTGLYKTFNTSVFKSHAKKFANNFKNFL